MEIVFLEIKNLVEVHDRFMFDHFFTLTLCIFYQSCKVLFGFSYVEEFGFGENRRGFKSAVSQFLKFD